MSDIPRLPTDPSVVEITDSHAPKNCKGCGDSADVYVFVTDEAVNERLGAGLSADEWPVNAFLCRECFGDAPRVSSWEELDGVPTAEA